MKKIKRWAMLLVVFIAVLLIRSGDLLTRLNPTAQAALTETTYEQSNEGFNYEGVVSVDGKGQNSYPYKKSDASETGDFEGYLKEFFCDTASFTKTKRALCIYSCSDGACFSLIPSPTLTSTTEPVCTDIDGDSFAVEGGACGEADCNDRNQFVNPGASEVCGNGIDDNCNGKVDGEDPACSETPNIVLVGWDGIQRDHFWQCFNKELPECGDGLPNIAQLKIYNLTITNGATETKPGWAQLLSGYNAEVTGVYNNGDYQPIPEGYTVFEKIEHHFGDANIVTMFITGKGEHTGDACVGEETMKNGQTVPEDKGQPWCYTSDHIDYYENGRFTNPDVGNRALELLELHQNEKIFALFHFRTPDVSGHVAGENSEYYSSGIIDSDYWLGQIIGKLKSLGIYDRTLIYVLSDHGFDEGDDRHGNAPYTIMATNDFRIGNRERNVDRRDIAPTILERYGISTGAIGTAPPVNGYSLYSPLPFTTVAAGGAFLDYAGGPACGQNLSLVGIIRPLGSRTCILPTGGTGDNSGYCTACGNGICELNENRCNCSVDCTR